MKIYFIEAANGKNYLVIGPATIEQAGDLFDHYGPGKTVSSYGLGEIKGYFAYLDAVVVEVVSRDKLLYPSELPPAVADEFLAQTSP